MFIECVYAFVLVLSWCAVRVCSQVVKSVQCLIQNQLFCDVLAIDILLPKKRKLQALVSSQEQIKQHLRGERPQGNIMDQLPDEIFLLILRCLPTKDIIRCSGVNQRFQQLSRDKTLWHTIDLSSCEVPLRRLGNLLKEHNVRILILKDAKIEDPTSWHNAVPRNQLHTINLSNAVVSARSVGHLLKSTSHLINLNVIGCVINHIAYKAISSNAQLRQLNLDSGKLAAAGLNAISLGCNSLEELNLGNMKELSTMLNYIKSASLRKLHVTHCELEYWDVKQLVQQCPNLTHLDISSNYVGQKGVEKIKTSFPALVELLNLNSLHYVSEHDSDYITDDYETEWDSGDDGLSDY